MTANRIFRVTLTVCITVLQILANVTAQDNTYNHNGLLCNLCPAGTRVRNHCTVSRATRCTSCAEGTYSSTGTYLKHCSRCSSQCRREHEIKVADCSPDHDIKCECEVGYWLTDNEQTYRKECMEHTACEPGYGVVEKGTSTADTSCEKCPDGFYSSIYSKDYPCREMTDCAKLGLVVKTPGTKWSDNECVDPNDFDESINIIEGPSDTKGVQHEHNTPDPMEVDSTDDHETDVYTVTTPQEQPWTTKDIIFIVLAVILGIGLTVALTLIFVNRKRICPRQSYNVEGGVPEEKDPHGFENDHIVEQKRPLMEQPIVYSEYELLKKQLHVPLNLSMDDPKRRQLHNMLHSFQLLDDPSAPKTPARFIPGRIRRRSASIRSMDTLDSPPASPLDMYAARNMKTAGSMDSVFTFNATDAALPSRAAVLERLTSTQPSGEELPDLPINATVQDLFMYVSRLIGIKRWKDAIRNMPGKKVSLTELDTIEANYRKDGYPEVIYQGFCSWRSKNPYTFNVLDAVTVALQKAEKVTLTERLVLAPQLQAPPKKTQKHN